MSRQAHHTHVHPGDTGTVTEGPFSGLEAVYQMTDAQQRAVVLLQMLRRPVPVKLDAVNLRKVMQ